MPSRDYRTAMGGSLHKSESTPARLMTAPAGSSGVRVASLVSSDGRVSGSQRSYESSLHVQISANPLVGSHVSHRSGSQPVLSRSESRRASSGAMAVGEPFRGEADAEPPKRKSLGAFSRKGVLGGSAWQLSTEQQKKMQEAMEKVRLQNKYKALRVRVAAAREAHDWATMEASLSKQMSVSQGNPILYSSRSLANRKLEKVRDAPITARPTRRPTRRRTQSRC